MIYQDYVSLMLNAPEEKRELFNLLWDATHGQYTPECLYHHKIENTDYNVLSKWFNTFYEGGLRSGIRYGRAWEFINQHKNYERAFKELNDLMYEHQEKADELFKKVFHLTLWRISNAEFVAIKLIEKLIKLTEKNIIKQEKSAEYFAEIEHYKLKFSYKGYDYNFYQVIIEICETWINRKSISE